jgi:transposase-like protein
MDKITFAAAQDSIKYFSYVELQRLKNDIDEQISKDRVGQAIAGRENKISACSHCQGKSFIRWGVISQGHQRYRCKGCNKTFSSLTGIALHRMRKPKK